MRPYRLGKRGPAVDRTRRRVLEAARELVAAGATPSVGAVAQRAGVSRITVYNHFGSRSGLIESLVEPVAADGLVDAPPMEQLRRLISERCARWAGEPALYRHLPPPAGPGDVERGLAERLAEADELRPGCSIKEAEDVIGALASFPVFDRLHRDGRRPPGAVAEIVMRLAQGVLQYHP